MAISERRKVYLQKFDQYRVTSHGENPWTDEALLNIAYSRYDMENARNLLGGTFTSVYRSKSVNKLVGGVKDSRHMLGLACDIKPDAKLKMDIAAAMIWSAAQSGSLGLVQQVIWEPTTVHVAWYAITAPDRGMNYLVRLDGAYEELDRWPKDEPNKVA